LAVRAFHSSAKTADRRFVRVSFFVHLWVVDPTPSGSRLNDVLAVDVQWV
jgi:hypothetical protein